LETLTKYGEYERHETFPWLSNDPIKIFILTYINWLI